MGIKTKVLIGDEWVEGEEIEFRPKQEDWNTYELEDGSIIRFKAIVTKVIRTEKRHPVRNEPIYSVSSTNVVEAIVPDKLKRS
ncbi:MAG: hypothetical protein SCM96_13590 [Acidobacteriota bacterium]|nr:hypothetical protein [Acidobacteriota bacterium]